jgi:hypothetical protein
MTENNESTLKYEYSEILDEEPISNIAQQTINIITDYNRNYYINQSINNAAIIEEPRVIEEIASTNLKSYLKRKKKVFHVCILNEITKLDIHTLGELIRGYEIETNTNIIKIMKMILVEFPNDLIKIAEKFNEDENNESDNYKIFKLNTDVWKEPKDVTTKELQNLLKIAMNKTEKINFCDKLAITTFDNNNILKLRQNCQNPKLRNIYFRLIHNDFYTHEKMKKFKMVANNECPRCKQTENLKHLVYSCYHANLMWTLYNEFIFKIKITNEKVTNYEDVFKIPTSQELSLVKIKLIQSMIQIERPTNWKVTDLIRMIRETSNILKYNATINRTRDKHDKKWENIYKWIYNEEVITGIVNNH